MCIRDRSYCVKKNPLLAGEILLLSGLTDLADGYIAKMCIRDRIISDIMMPVMDGYELVSELRSAGYQIPVLMILSLIHI